MSTKSCFQCANVAICKYCDSVAELGSIIKDVKALAMLVAGSCAHFTEIKE